MTTMRIIAPIVPLLLPEKRLPKRSKLIRLDGDGNADSPRLHWHQHWRKQHTHCHHRQSLLQHRELSAPPQSHSVVKLRLYLPTSRDAITSRHITTRRPRRFTLGLHTRRIRLRLYIRGILRDTGSYPIHTMPNSARQGYPLQGRLTLVIILPHSNCLDWETLPPTHPRYKAGGRKQISLRHSTGCRLELHPIGNNRPLRSRCRFPPNTPHSHLIHWTHSRSRSRL